MRDSSDFIFPSNAVKIIDEYLEKYTKTTNKSYKKLETLIKDLKLDLKGLFSISREGISSLETLTKLLNNLAEGYLHIAHHVDRLESSIYDLAALIKGMDISFRSYSAFKIDEIVKAILTYLKEIKLTPVRVKEFREYDLGLGDETYNHSIVIKLADAREIFVRILKSIPTIHTLDAIWAKRGKSEKVIVVAPDLWGADEKNWVLSHKNVIFLKLTCKPSIILERKYG